MATFRYPATTISTAGSATEAKQDAQIALLTTIDADTSTLAAVDYATETTLAALEAKDFATETTLASLEAKDFATETTLAAAAVDIATLAGTVAGTELQVDVLTTPGLTDTQLRATPVPVSGPLTDTELRATAVPVSGPLTDTELRATPVPVSGTITATATNLDIRDLTSVSDSVSAVQSGTWNIADISGTISLPAGAATEATLADILTDTGTLAGTVTSGKIQTDVITTAGLTDTQLRATPVPVSGTVTANTGLTQPLTDTQLRATAVPVSATDLDIRDLSNATDSVAAVQSGTWNITNISGVISLPTGAAAESTLAVLNAKTAAALIPTAHDFIALTYVTVGNGIGEIETVVYKTGGSGGSTVGTLTLAYDANNKLSSVTKS